MLSTNEDETHVNTLYKYTFTCINYYHCVKVYQLICLLNDTPLYSQFIYKIFEHKPSLYVFCLFKLLNNNNSLNSQFIMISRIAKVIEYLKLLIMSYWIIIWIVIVLLFIYLIYIMIYRRNLKFIYKEIYKLFNVCDFFSTENLALTM